MRRMLAFSALMLASSLAGATYRWTDASGQVHYTQDPPPKGVEGSYVRPPPPPSSNPNQDSLNKSLQKEQKDAPAKAAAAAQADTERAAKEAECSKASADLTTLDSQTANRLRVTEEEYQARRGELTTFLAEHCR